jgi:hypothetical protein
MINVCSWHKADIEELPINVCFDPCSDPTSCQLNFSFDGKAGPFDAFAFLTTQPGGTGPADPAAAIFLPARSLGVPTRSAE